MPAIDTLLGVGIYSIAEGSHLTGVHPSRIRRWLKGYSYPAKQGLRRSPPVWRGQHAALGTSIALGFLDLMEIRFVDKFRDMGIPWRTLREVAALAEREY